ncbi:MAG: metallophosphoesterase family protein, partial [Bacteroidota bacterium]
MSTGKLQDRVLIEHNIGQLKGPVLVFGGVYSNLHALQALYQIAQEKGIPSSNIVCTGDIAGYCAYPNECLHFLADWGIHAITGNVEENIRDGLDDCGCGFGEDSRCDLFARMWYPYAKQMVDVLSDQYVKQLPAKIRFEYAGQQGIILHGSYRATAEFIWQSTPWEEKLLSFEDADVDLILAGHCGLPFAHQVDEKTWLNAGVIGMPANDGSQSVWYLLLNDGGGELSYSFQQLEYDHQAARAAMLERPLPKSYALTLKSGIWDNTEIMPDWEAQREGIPLTSAAITRK